MELSLAHIANTQIVSNVEDWTDILDNAIQNDRRAQHFIYTKYQSKWLGLCSRYFKNRDDALEALNHGFLKIFNNLDQFQRDKDFGAWGYRIIQNTAIDYARKKLKQADFVEVNSVENEVFISSKALSKLGAQDLLDAVHQLPNATALVFNMFAIEGYKHHEIASQLGISVGTSKWHVNAARLQLKKQLEHENER